MTSMTAPVIATVVRDFDAPAERVFDAWLDPAQASRFLFAAGPGEKANGPASPSRSSRTGRAARSTSPAKMAAEWAAYQERTRHGWTMIVAGLAQTMETEHD